MTASVGRDRARLGDGAARARPRRRPRRSGRPATPGLVGALSRTRSCLSALTRRVVTGPDATARRLGDRCSTGSSRRSASLNRSIGGTRRSTGAAARGCSDAPTRRAALAHLRSTSNTLPLRNSRRSVLCHRSTLPVVVGDRGAVRMWVIPFSVTDPIEQHRSRARPEPGGEHLAVVGQDLFGHPMDVIAWLERVAHRPRRRPSARPSRTRRTGVVIDPRHDLRLGPIDDAHPADDVHLPQLHRPRSFPPLVIRPLPLPSLRRHQTRDESGNAPPTSAPATDHTPPDRARTGSCAAPTPDAPDASPRSAPRPPGPSDADTTTAWSCDPANPASPSAAYRRNHSCTVWRATPYRRATSVTVAPSLRTSNTAR